MRKLSKSIQKFAALAGAASAFIAIPVLAQGIQVPSTQTQPTAPSTAPATTSPTSGRSIVDIAASNDSFKTLTAALKAAGLAQTLAAGGPYTVFAPTDAAFAALPKGTLEQLLKPENKAILVKILTYHVVSGEKPSSSLKTGEAKTLEGSPVQVKVSSNGVMVNNAKVIQPDVRASNGIIHAIDKVILPPEIQSSLHRHSM